MVVRFRAKLFAFYAQVKVGMTIKHGKEGSCCCPFWEDLEFISSMVLVFQSGEIWNNEEFSGLQRTYAK